MKFSIDDKGTHPSDIEAAEKLIAMVGQKLSFGKELVEVIQIRFEKIGFKLLVMEVKIILVTPLLRDRLEVQCILTSNKPPYGIDELYQGSFSEAGQTGRAGIVLNEIKRRISGAIDYKKDEIRKLEDILQRIQTLEGKE